MSLLRRRRRRVEPDLVPKVQPQNPAAAGGEEQPDEDLLVRRLRNLRWPDPPTGARERGWAAIEARLQALDEEDSFDDAEDEDGEDESGGAAPR